MGHGRRRRTGRGTRERGRIARTALARPRAIATLGVVAVTLAAGALLAVRPSLARAAPAPIGAHSMLQLNDPPSFMAAMFAEAAALGASEIRLDVAPALIYPDPDGPPDFSGLDQVIALSELYDVPVLGDLFTVPPALGDCATPASGSAMARCPPGDLSVYAAEIAAIVTHADPVIHDWEVWNEPDNGQFFDGTPQQYAWMLRTAHDAIAAVDPSARILLGGVSGPAAAGWLAQVFATPGADAAQAFEIANVHERATLDGLAPDITAWRAFFASYGFTGPLWVTEHGYPSDPTYQYDPAWAAGPPSQAAYLTASIPTLIAAGAAEVFVTERDNLTGAFASEGLLGGDVSDPPVADPSVVPKPAFSAVGALASCYASTGADCAQPPPAASTPALSVRPTPPGAASTATVTIADSGAEPEALGSVALLGGAPDPFSVVSDSCSNRILEPDESCELTVRFAPLAGGAATASLQLPSDHGPLVLPVASVAPSVASLIASPASRRRFVADAGHNGAGHPQLLRLRVSDPLSAPVRVGGVSVTGPEARRFTVRADGCRWTTLAPDRGCSLEVRFLAQRPGGARARLSLAGDGSPLEIALRAHAAPVPVVLTARVSARPTCGAPDQSTWIEATIDRPAALDWRLRRLVGSAPATCAISRRGGELRSSLSGEVSARPSGPGAARARAAFRLAGLRPGSYRLRLQARDVHGTGPTRTLRVAVGARGREPQATASERGVAK